MDNKEEHYILKTSKYDFNLTISYNIRDEELISQTLFIGGNKKGCVVINVPAILDRNSRYYNMYKSNVAKIPHLFYDKNCCINKELDSGYGTRYMIKTILKIVKERYSHIDTFEFDDASKIECILDGTNREISLAHYSVALYGKTWYERNFNAELKDNDDKIKYKNAVQIFSDPTKKLSFMIAFADYYYGEDRIKFDKLESIYNKTNTYNEFFIKLKEEYKEKFCEITVDWLDNFVNKLLGRNYMNSTWIIKVNNMNTNVSINSMIISNEKPKYNIQSGGVSNGRNVLMSCRDL
jgi:hypothetical protein